MSNPKKIILIDDLKEKGVVTDEALKDLAAKINAESVQVFTCGADLGIELIGTEDEDEREAAYFADLEQQRIDDESLTPCECTLCECHSLTPYTLCASCSNNGCQG